jgi:hypothetical protein
VELFVVVFVVGFVVLPVELVVVVLVAGLVVFVEEFVLFFEGTTTPVELVLFVVGFVVFVVELEVVFVAGFVVLVELVVVFVVGFVVFVALAFELPVIAPGFMLIWRNLFPVLVVTSCFAFESVFTVGVVTAGGV